MGGKKTLNRRTSSYFSVLPENYILLQIVRKKKKKSYAARSAAVKKKPQAKKNKLTKTCNEYHECKKLFLLILFMLSGSRQRQFNMTKTTDHIIHA